MHSKQTSAAVAGLALLASLAVGCSSDATSADTTTGIDTTSGSSAAPIGSKPGKVVYLINGSLGDKSFYDSGQAGIDAIKSEYGVETRTIEDGFDAGKYEANLAAAIDFADVIFTISYGFEDQLIAAADAHPDKVIVNLDTVVTNPRATITSVDFVEEESAYLAGAAAGMLTIDTTIAGVNADKVIGVVAGDQDPVVDAFLFAYENGAKSIDPDITVQRKYLGGAWDDQAKGKQAALQLFDAKADVVFQVAAAAGLGVLQAARERNLYAIGVDSNQNDIEPGHVVASDVKQVGRSIEKVFASVVDGSYAEGTVISAGLKDGGVDLVLDAAKPVLPVGIQTRLTALRTQIIDGTLIVERYKPAGRRPTP